MYENYKVSNYEYCKNVEPIVGPGISKMKVEIPKYMTNMETGNWERTVSIKETMFVNAGDCRLRSLNTVREQGYYTIEKFPNETLDFTTKMKNGIIPVGTRFLAEVLFEDMNLIRLTGKV